MKCVFLFLLVFVFAGECYSQDSPVVIRVHFLYGSKPRSRYETTEPKWFGGKPGGHAGIEYRKDSIIDFLHWGRFHLVQKRGDKHGQYKIHSIKSFYAILGGNPDSVKKAIVIIPITRIQKRLLDSLVINYRINTPYDYALIGMRCAAATYDILSRLGILKPLSFRKTYLNIFFPRKLRKRLFKKARKSGWVIERQEGSEKRKWDKD